MAATNGLMQGSQAAKVDSYPVLNQDSGTFLVGTGTWTAVSEATSSQAGFMSAADKAFLDALKGGTLANPTFNATTGAAEYKYNNTVLLTIPVAVGS